MGIYIVEPACYRSFASLFNRHRPAVAAATVIPSGEAQVFRETTAKRIAYNRDGATEEPENQAEESGGGAMARGFRRLTRKKMLASDFNEYV